MRRFHAVIVGVFIIFLAGAAHAHQVNLSTARVELRPDRTVAVEVALKGSDADRLAGTQVFDAQKDLADPAKVAASAAPIAAYVSAHTSVTGTDGKPCVPGTPASCRTATASSCATRFSAAMSPATSFTTRRC